MKNETQLIPGGGEVSLLVSPAPWGVAHVMLNLLGGLLEKKWPVQLVVPELPPGLRRHIPRGASVTELAISSEEDWIPALAGYLQEADPKFLLTATHPLNLAAIRAREKSGRATKVVVSLHRNFSAHQKFAPHSASPQVVALMQRTYPCADRIVAVSEGVSEDFGRVARIPDGKISVIGTAVVTPEMDRLRTQPAPHPWLKEEKIPVILGIGRLARDKDFPTLLKAFSLASAVRPLRLIILGEGSLGQRLRNLAAKLKIAQRVDFAGFVENPYAYLNAATLFVLSSRAEGLPGALIESMACGTPVVSTDCPSGPAEILEHGRLGPLVPMGDPAAMAKAILATLESPPESSTLRRRAMDFSQQRIAEAYADLFSQLV